MAAMACWGGRLGPLCRDGVGTKVAAGERKCSSFVQPVLGMAAVGGVIRRRDGRGSGLGGSVKASLRGSTAKRLERYRARVYGQGRQKNNGTDDHWRGMKETTSLTGIKIVWDWEGRGAGGEDNDVWKETWKKSSPGALRESARIIILKGEKSVASEAVAN
ncbi:hypothetical protein I7I51_07849 [Histoplasma capsulatum]|uniref:Uncharacterized protein n=1 Tax=Ajellomyces capsulatus TaxID=5037 RepID=A0A8A1M0W0_AJECA|nr:predicted protein [Histoplasma mississippiense (nom. inval.)]EDN02831.1 predicted protein [Histoplasma mississippiense (nom. inval.)]QSS58423.1 hypothetical protein I7I51_07849 [Histoplasma capsulatum]